MQKSEKKLAELGRVLDSGNHNEINKRINHLRMEAPFVGALTVLALYYDKSDDESIRLAITDFFNDMKDNDGRVEVIESIAVVSRQDSKAMLVASCWQSGLCYSEHAMALVDTFMTGDYMTSLECFTVIDDCSASISDSDRTSIIFKLGNVIETYDTPRKKLAGEMISLLKK